MAERRRADARRPSVDDRRGAADVRAGDEHPGAAQSQPGGSQAIDRGRHQRLGRRLAGHARSRQPGGALAGARRCCARATAAAGKLLVERLAIYPEYARDAARWLDPALRTAVLRASDADGSRRAPTTGSPGTADRAPARHGPSLAASARRPALASGRGSVARSVTIAPAPASDARARPTSCACSQARGADFDAVCAAADALRAKRQRRRRQLCRQPQHQLHQHLLLTAASSAPSPRASSARICAAGPTISTSTRSRGASREAWERGATEVCLQGGIHPDYTGDDLSRDLPRRESGGARTCTSTPSRRSKSGTARETLGMPLARLPRRAEATPGSAACRAPPPKSSTTRCAPSSARTSSRPREWLEVMETAHRRRPAHHRHDHVRPRRPLRALGAASAAHPRAAGRNRRLHRVRAAAVRAHGSADLSARAARARARPFARRC